MSLPARITEGFKVDINTGDDVIENILAQLTRFVRTSILRGRNLS